MNPEVTKYLSLPYTIFLRRDDEGDFIARIQELDGCVAHGATQQEALEKLAEMQALWIEDALEAGDPVPTPEDEGSLPSGKWLQRIPRTLHRKAVALAKAEGVSLNHLVATLIATAVGQKVPAPTERNLVPEPPGRFYGGGVAGDVVVYYAGTRRVSSNATRNVLTYANSLCKQLTIVSEEKEPLFDVGRAEGLRPVSGEPSTHADWPEDLVGSHK